MQSPNGNNADSFSKKSGEDDPRTESTKNTSPTRKHLTARIAFQIFCLAWIIPILFMLVKNFRTWIIGASAYCPDGRCWADIFDLSLDKVFSTARRLDARSHDLIAALQFVAKALEVWFIVIATSFVYLYTMILAEQAEGLPVRYLTWSNELSDITSIFDRSLWTAAYSRQNKGKSLVFRLPIFVAITVFLCLLCALMGPCVAVVIIPNLQWIPTPSIGDRVFHEMNSASPPNATALLSTIELQYPKTYSPISCTVPELAAGNYSCTANTLGFSLDTVVTSYLDFINSISPNFGLIQENTVSSWIWNASDEHPFRKTSLWTPNRQVLRLLGVDREIIYANGADIRKKLLGDVPHYESYKIYNRSLEMRVERNGPMIGARPNVWNLESNSMAWTTRIDSDRSIRCYQNYSIQYNGTLGPPYTRCIRLGTGWNSDNKHTNFSLSGFHEPLSGRYRPGVNFTASFSDRTTFFDGPELPSWLSPGCLSNRKNGNVSPGVTCDWDRLFSIDVPHLANRTRNVNTWDIFHPNDTSTPFMSIDFVAYVGFGLYQLDPSPAINPLALVQTLNVPTTGPPLVIDPHWSALAFSADVSGIVPANRTSPIQFLHWLNESPNLSVVVAYLAIYNMLTHLPYSTLPRSNATIDSEHPLLQRNGTVYLYAYRVNGRTSLFSMIVVIIGVVVVIAHAVLFSWYYRPHKKMKDVMIAALEHRPEGEFVDATTPKRAVKTLFKVEHTDKGVGELVFKKQD